MIKTELKKLFTKASFTQKLLLLILLALLLNFGLLDEPETTTVLEPTPTPIAEPLQNPTEEILEFSTFETATVARVVDGDTIVLEDGRKVRYIGIDTPETVDPNRPVGCFGKEASVFNTQLVDKKQVWLEKDVSDMDRYGRLLRYVYILPEGSEPTSENLIAVNELLLSRGYAISSEYKPDIKYQPIFEELQQTAIDAKLGLWADEVCNTVN